MLTGSTAHPLLRARSLQKREGFTLVELIIIVIVIVILIVVIQGGVVRAMAQSRDHQRESRVTAISEALENYFQKKGEYPPVIALASDYGATNTSVATLLNIDEASLKMPQFDASLALVSNTSPSYGTDDVIVYDATRPSNSLLCTSTITGGCDNYTLRYQSEISDIVEVKGRHNSL